MAGKSPVVVSDEQRVALAELSQSRDRAEADRARAVLLTASGWTSPRSAEAFGLRQDTVRLWRGAVMRGGVEALRTCFAPGPAATRGEAALAVAEQTLAEQILAEPVTNRPNWTLARLSAEIEKRAGVRLSPAHLSVVLRQRGRCAGAGPATP